MSKNDDGIEVTYTKEELENDLLDKIADTLPWEFRKQGKEVRRKLARETLERVTSEDGRG